MSRTERSGSVKHRSFRTRIVPMGVVCGALIAAGIGYATHVPAQSKYLGVDEVKPGMKGYGYTVMSGSKPEKFDVEIISTLHSFRPGQELFIVKTDHPRLQAAKVVAGMSGSPVYIDGKMIGAYAYGWFFSAEPIAGVTPIKHMLDDLKRPVPKVLAPYKASLPLLPTGATASVGPTNLPKRPGNRFDGEALEYDARKHADAVAKHIGPKLKGPVGHNLSPATTELMVAGLSPNAISEVEKFFKPMGMSVLQAGAGGSAKKEMMESAPKNYVDGGAITVQLVRGDVSIAGLGTVTHVLGKQLVAFGHPMLGGGVENLPTALGHVHWILASASRSFKLGEPTRPLGALVNDRQASIVVHTDRVAPVFKAKLRVHGAPGAPKTEWDLEIAHDQFFAPIFAAIGMGTALEVTAGERNDTTWRADTVMKVKGIKKPLKFKDFGAGNRIPLGVSDIFRAQLVRAIGALLNNPWEMGHIESVEMDIHVTHKREVAFVRGISVLDKEIDPGDPARIKLTLQPWMGKRTEKIIEVPLPKRFAGRSVYISLEPGFMTSKVVAPPENFKDLVDILPKLSFPPETLIASYRLPDESTIAFEGRVAKRVPAHAADMMSITSSTISPVVFGAMQQIEIPTKGFIVGRNSVSVYVRPNVK